MGELPAERKTSDTGPATWPVVSPAPAGTSRAEWGAVALSVLWLALVAAFWLFVPGPEAGTPGANPAALVMTVVGIVLPVVMIWVAAITLRTAQEMRSEAQALKVSLEAMRSAWLNQNQIRAGHSLEKKLDEVAIAARQAETALATFSTRRDAAPAQPPAERKAALATPKPAAPIDDQPALALGTPAEELAPPVSVADFIRAMQFPDNAEDKDGFRALRRALEDRTVAKLLRAAQDVLNLLAQDGIYMDDLKPDRARPELWRRFAKGERGREIAALGGVRDRSSLALTAGRMRADTIFRDAAHHFLRQFDRTFTEFEQNASDQEVAEMAETRTARAFMLLGRVTGTFD